MHMGAFGFDDDVSKPENSTSGLRFRGFSAVKTLFRILEIILVLFFLKWASTRLPFAVRISGEYFRQLVSVILSRLFVFLLGNLIVLTLFLKSRQLNIGKARLDFGQEFVGDIGGRTCETFPPLEEIPCQDKLPILEGPRLVRRSQSENLRRGKSSEEDKRLRRSETERRRRAEEVTGVDELTDKEFQRAIESFIAKQIKFHQEEKLAIVLHG